MNERNGEINTVSLMNKKTFMCAFKATLPVFAGYMVLGMGFGILMHSKGYAWYWSVLMSIIVFAGSMQYVAVDLFSSGASLITYAIMTLVVNARHIFYGLTMLVKYKDVKKAKPYLIFALTDETFSLVCDVDLEKDIDKDNYYFLVSILNQSYWVIGSLLGGILGAVIPIILTIYGYTTLYNYFGGQVFGSSLAKLLPPVPFVYLVSLLLLLIGAAVGMFGSYSAVRKHLKI